MSAYTVAVYQTDDLGEASDLAVTLANGSYHSSKPYFIAAGDGSVVNGLTVALAEASRDADDDPTAVIWTKEAMTG